MPDKQRCEATVWTRERWPHAYQCERTGTVQSGGKMFCKQHAPKVASGEFVYAIYDGQLIKIPVASRTPKRIVLAARPLAVRCLSVLEGNDMKMVHDSPKAAWDAEVGRLSELLKQRQLDLAGLQAELNQAKREATRAE